jgi:hypothetical protein
MIVSLHEEFGKYQETLEAAPISGGVRSCRVVESPGYALADGVPPAA